MQLSQQPRAWQIDALKRWVAAGRRGIAEVVTGAGKTLFAEMCMMDFGRVCPDPLYIIVVPTQALLDQWFVSLVEDLSVTPDEISVWSHIHKSPAARAWNLMVINTARWAAPPLADPHASMLIIDECHRAGANKNTQALDGTHRATLGLSATPLRPYDDAFEVQLKPKLGETLISYTLAEAAHDGILAPFDLVNVKVPLIPYEEREYQRLTRQIAKALRGRDDPVEPKTDDPRVKQLLLRRARLIAQAAMRVPTAVAIMDKHRGTRTLIFHEDIHRAEELLGLLIDRGQSATIYHSRMNTSIRRDNLRLFRRGVFDILVSCRALDEGIDVPEARMALIAAASATERQRVQRLGRVLRPAPGKEVACVYTLYATEAEERRLRQGAESSGARRVTWQTMSVRNV